MTVRTTIPPENRPLIKQICGHKGQIITATLAKLYRDRDGRDNWVDVGVQGALVFQRETQGDGEFAFRIIDVKQGVILWEAELVGTYTMDCDFFHIVTSATGEKYGLSFMDVGEAVQFYEIVEKKRSASGSTGFKPPMAASGVSKISKDPPGVSKISKDMIGGPRGFQHVSHVGFDGREGRVIVENVSADMERMLKVGSVSGMGSSREIPVQEASYPAAPIKNVSLAGMPQSNVSRPLMSSNVSRPSIPQASMSQPNISRPKTGVSSSSEGSALKKVPPPPPPRRHKIMTSSANDISFRANELARNEPVESAAEVVPPVPARPVKLPDLKVVEDRPKVPEEKVPVVQRVPEEKVPETKVPPKEPEQKVTKPPEEKVPPKAPEIPKVSQVSDKLPKVPPPPPPPPLDVPVVHVVSKAEVPAVVSKAEIPVLHGISKAEVPAVVSKAEVPAVRGVPPPPPPPSKPLDKVPIKEQPSTDGPTTLPDRTSWQDELEKKMAHLVKKDVKMTKEGVKKTNEVKEGKDVTKTTSVSNVSSVGGSTCCSLEFEELTSFKQEAFPGPASSLSSSLSSVVGESLDVSLGDTKARACVDAPPPLTYGGAPPPPPPPPPKGKNVTGVTSSSASGTSGGTSQLTSPPLLSSGGAPPPPPPPPTKKAPNPSQVGSNPSCSSPQKASHPMVPPPKASSPMVVDTRDQLMAAIRQGKPLKKATTTNSTPKSTSTKSAFEEMLLSAVKQNRKAPETKVEKEEKVENLKSVDPWA